MVLGLDISYKRTGYCEIKGKEVKIGRVEGEAGTSFRDILNRALIQSKEIIDSVDITDKHIVAVEEPFSGGMFSSGLFALDTLVCSEILKKTDTIWFYHPSALGFYIDKKNRTKTDSVVLAKTMLDIFIEEGFTVNRTKISHDEADATIYAVITYLNKTDCLDLKRKVERSIPKVKVDKAIKFTVGGNK